MCSYQEWERRIRRVQEAVDEGQLREFLADAAARVEAFQDEGKAGGARQRTRTGLVDAAGDPGPSGSRSGRR